MGNVATLSHRSYAVIADSEHGLRLMAASKGWPRLRIDRQRESASLVGLVSEVVDQHVYSSVWTPVPYLIAVVMAESLHLMPEKTIGDERAWRIGWRDAGYDGDVADWYCWGQ